MPTCREQEEAPSFRIWLCGAFRVERRVGTVSEVIRTVEWGGSSYPRLLLKALLCCPGRQARREALLDLLWRETDPQQSTQYLNTATTKLRKVLEPGKGQTSLLLTEEDGRHYLLEGQSLLWVDADAALALLKEVERLGRTSPQALPLLEQATAYLQCGTFLDGEEGDWVLGKRATVERAAYRCRLWLAEAYEQQGMPGQAETIISALFEEDPTDEDALCRLMELLHRQGMTQQALRLYERTCEILADEGSEPTEATRSLVIHLRENRYRPEALPVDPLSFERRLPFLNAAHPESPLFTPFTVALSQGIVLAVKALGAQELQASSPLDARQGSHKASPDLLSYKRHLRLAFHLHRTGSAQGILQEVNADIRALEQLEQHARGQDLFEVKEILIGHLLLAAKIVKDQQHYEQAVRSANSAVQVATSLEDGDLIATTRYLRGCVMVEWAQSEIITQGRAPHHTERVRNAIREFQEILAPLQRRRTSLHPQLHGWTLLQLGRAFGLLQEEDSDSSTARPLLLMDQAANMVGCDPIEDAYARLLLTGTLSGLHWGAYHLNKMELFLAMGMPDRALAELTCLKQLSEQEPAQRTYPQEERRNQAWRQIVTAEVLLEGRAYPEATTVLRSALLACRSINSLRNAAAISKIYGRLVHSPAGTSAEVQEIGALLKEWKIIA